MWLEQEPIPVFFSQIAKIKNQAKECPLWGSDLVPLIQLFAVLLRFIGIPDHYTFLGKLPTYPSPKPILFPKWEISVSVDLGEG